MTVVVAALVATSACNVPDDKRRPTLLTFADLQALADDPTALTAGPDGPVLFPDHGIPGGLLLSDYISSDAAGYHLTLRSTFTEGYRSGYVTTELWADFDEVWAQPAYVPITGIVNGVAQRLKGEGGVWHPIFSLGPKSAFYSPYWQVFYFQVPADTAPDAYTSAKQVIDSGIPLIPGPAWTMAMVPGEVVLPTMPPDTSQGVGGPQKISDGWLDGQHGAFLDLGSKNFRFDDQKVVEEIPLFVLLYRHPDGTLERLKVPTVAGTGPLYANRQVQAPDNHPLYGAYWRVYTVEIPPTARIFAPPALDEFRTGLPMALYDVPYDPVGLTPTTSKDTLDAYVGRVALNAQADATHPTGCFQSILTIDIADTPVEKRMPGSCEFLDSQPAIERAVLPEAIKKTGILVTCPFVSYHDFPVTP